MIIQTLKCLAKMQGIFKFSLLHLTWCEVLYWFYQQSKEEKYDLSIKSHWQSKNDENGTFIQLEPEYIPRLRALEIQSHQCPLVVQRLRQ